jgi:hypothetical protein
MNSQRKGFSSSFKICLSKQPEIPPKLILRGKCQTDKDSVRLRLFVSQSKIQYGGHKYIFIITRFPFMSSHFHGANTDILGLLPTDVLGSGPIPVHVR